MTRSEDKTSLGIAGADGNLDDQGLLAPAHLERDDLEEVVLVLGLLETLQRRGKSAHP